MASTGIGYQPRTITREQPTSSGQMLNFSSGCELNINAGAQMTVGGTLSLSSGASLLNSVVQATSGRHTAIDSGGVTFITASTKWVSNSTAANAYIKTPSAGERKSIVIYNTTRVVEIAASTAKSVTFGAAASKGFSLSVAPTTKMKAYGVQVDLLALTTAVWIASCPKPPIADSTGFVNDPVTITSGTMA